jgi:glucose dehydrogenase
VADPAELGPRQPDGPNLYTNSLLALDHATGQLRWFQEVKPHDLWDLDFQAPPIFTTANVGGSAREVVIGSGKLGKVVAFDAATGEILWTTPVGLHQNDDVTGISPGQTPTVSPGALGGVETPIAYADGVVYAPYLEYPSPFTTPRA